MLVTFMIVFSLFLFTQNAYAGTTTDNPVVRVSPGEATLTGSPEINVAVDYSGDDVSSNNSITIEWGLDGVDFSLGTQVSGAHPASPYNYTITPLDNSKTYQIRVTITDPDNVPTDNVKVYTGRKAYNPLLHNAVSTGSGVDKWPTGWGIAEGQYGAFSCAVCHEKKSGNIKRIRKDWSDSSLPDVPAKLNSVTVEFNSTANGSAEYALDDSTDHASSNRICEACHTQTAHHRHDESTPGGTDHQSSNDCIDCHNHSNAFAPSGGCSSCHGGSMNGLTESNFWPDSVSETTDNSGSANDSGEHRVHMERLSDKVLNLTLTQLLDDADSANKQLQLCNYCHENPGSDGDHMSGDDAEVTRFLATDGSADTGTAGAYSGSCSALDCHNGIAVASPDWYAGSVANCLMCHSEDNTNSERLIDPTSGLHFSAAPNGAVLHDGNFSGSGDCLSCHQATPSDKHFNNIADTPDTATYSFQATAGLDIKLDTLNDATDDTCAADCHSDGGAWYRAWSAEAFDATAVDISQPLPARCKVCHGVFLNWTEGSSHARTYQETGSLVGNSHNSQNPIDNPGAACEDCHNYPSDLARHENGKLTINDDTGNAVDPVKIAEGFYCAPCHGAPAIVPDDYPPSLTSEVIPLSVFPEELVDNGSNYPIESCFSGAMGCHGDKQQRWWPAAAWPADPTSPAYRTDGTTNYGYPNRAGAHPQHNITLGLRIAETRTGIPGTAPTDQDYNATCRFCHPMQQNEYGSWVVPEGKHRDGIVDMFGGSRFDGANEKGLVLSGDPATGNWINYNNYPNATDGYLYQLDNPENPGSLYPLDRDVAYRQYLYEYRDNPDVNHGTCSQVACHSNSPFTPQWYGDEQPPGLVTDLKGFTHNQDAAVHNIYEQDAPGTVHLYWKAPGDNGDLDGTAYEYEVYYSTSPIDDSNIGSATRAGGAPTVYRKGDAQVMVVDGMPASTPYYFAVQTKDQPRYKDTNGDGIYETFVTDGGRSQVASVGPVTTHIDDVMPVFWGANQAVSHDNGSTVNLSWESARDHTLPITYLVYWSDYSLKTHLANGETLPPLVKPGQYDGGVYSFGYTDPSSHAYTVYVSTTTGMSYQVTGLGSGVLYNFMVRAEDGHDPVGDGTGIGNIDDNTVVAMALPSKLPQETEKTVMGIMSATSNIIMQNDPLNPDWGSVSSGSASLTGTDSVTFIATGELDGTSSRETWVQGISLDLQVENGDRKLPQSFDVQLGYQNGSFTPIGSAVSIGIGRRANRVMKVGLSANKGTVPANTPLAVRFTRTTSSGSTSSINLDWGDSTNKGQILITAQPINHQPSAVSFGSLSRSTGGYIDITWSPSNDGTPSDGGQTLHYDIFGSADNGSTWPFIIGTNLTDADAVAGVRWDTVGDGLDHFNGTGIFDCKVKVEVSDGYLYELTPGSGNWTSHRVTSSGTIPVDNSQDDEAPAAVTISHEEPRPKQGAVFLHWIAVGNDGYNHGTRAAYYDVRFRKVSDGTLNAASWNDAATIQAEGEPVPGFAGTAEEFELLNMTPDTSHQTAIVTCDAGEDDIAGNADDNCSGLSNVYTITSGQYYCGICHSTPPDEPDTKGIHRQHGYTLEDCAKCHGDGTSPDGNDVTRYDGRHYDGVINIGWAKDSSGNHLTMVEIPSTTTSSVTVNQGSGVIYSDPDGSGGYNSGGPYTATANTDSGRCMNFIGANANGCHGPFSPQWAPDTNEPSPKEPACADCHGDDNSAGTRQTDPYGRTWDCNVAGDPSKLVKASPPQANHGGTTTTDRYVGAHERHLNSSFRFAKGDSCRLCHRDTFDLGLHADGNVDVIFDQVADQDDAIPAVVDQAWAEVDIKGASCGSMNNAYCHDSGANWAEPGAKCNDCHGMNGLTYDTVSNTSQIGHVMGAMGDVVACTTCHVAGHPQSPDGINPGDPDTLLINNNAAIGINYRSGGIHLKRVYPWGTFNSLAQICWGCHDQNHDGILREVDGDISEFETNTRVATGNSPYHLGQLDQSNWIGAIWTSGYGKTSSDPFWYKRGYIQSTHTTDPSGTSKVTWNDAEGRYVETVDTVDKIRCSNCHDVHNLNLAPGDTMTGMPYLRGTWMTNPYEEDGAPYNKAYTSQSVMGQVPRGGTAYDELGGYYIDQNNVVPGTGNGSPTAAHYPTSGWTIQSSAGLCVLCHGDNVDEMDQRDDATDGNVLWLGTNGHSNSALGGTFSAAVNVFDYSHGRPTPSSFDWGGGRPRNTTHIPVQVPDMAYLDQGNFGLAGGGYRGTDGNAGGYNPPMVDGFVGSASQPYAFNVYNWGATVDGTTTDQMYHQFSCSKCHNPHASRLPKLLITNCLDIRHNTWDDARSSLQNTFTAAALTAVDRGMPAAYYASAQNCHRFDGRRANTTLRGGWNKVTPWAFDNDETPSEHKGTQTPVYAPRPSN